MGNYPNDPTTGGYPPPPQYGQYPPQQPGYPPSGPMPPYPQQPGYPQMPPQQPQQAPKKKSKVLWIVLGLVVAVVACGVIANGGKSSTGTKVDTTTNSANTGSTSSQPPSQQHFKVGDTVKAGDKWEVTVNSVKTAQGNDIVSPKPGNTFVVLDVSMKNISSQEQNESSLIQWTFKGTDGQKYEDALYSDSGSSSLDGKVEAGGPLKGELAYEVPASVKAFTLSFEAQAFGSGQTIWDISV